MLAPGVNLARWPDPCVPYWFDAGTHWGRLGSVHAQAAFGWAAGLWNALCGIRLIQVAMSTEAKLLVTADAIDSTRDLLAWTEPASNSETVHRMTFNSAESWAFAASLPPGWLDLGRVAAHELGHCLGLMHGPDGCLMAPRYDAAVRVPQPWDEAEALARYPLVPISGL